MDGEGGWEEGWFPGKSGKFCPPFPQYPEGGKIIVEGISAANNIIQREELVESTLLEKRRTGERATARQCLLPGAGKRPAAEPASQRAPPALERMPGRMRTWALEEDAELLKAGWQRPPRAGGPVQALVSPCDDCDRLDAPGGRHCAVVPY